MAYISELGLLLWYRHSMCFDCDKLNMEKIKVLDFKRLHL